MSKRNNDERTIARFNSQTLSCSMGVIEQNTLRKSRSLEGLFKSWDKNRKWKENTLVPDIAFNFTSLDFYTYIQRVVSTG